MPSHRRRRAQRLLCIIQPFHYTPLRGVDKYNNQRSSRTHKTAKRKTTTLALESRFSPKIHWLEFMCFQLRYFHSAQLFPSARSVCVRRVTESLKKECAEDVWYMMVPARAQWNAMWKWNSTTHWCARPKATTSVNISATEYIVNSHHKQSLASQTAHIYVYIDLCPRKDHQPPSRFYYYMLKLRFLFLQHFLEIAYSERAHWEFMSLDDRAERRVYI